ncbi:MAG: hypothetical protein WC109_01810 [Syntrophomonadaceae bacterium]|nr:hypothetical protein [Syntrophomonadaceae bacterium]
MPWAGKSRRKFNLKTKTVATNSSQNKSGDSPRTYFWALNNDLPLAGKIPFSNIIVQSIAQAEIPATNPEVRNKWLRVRTHGGFIYQLPYASLLWLVDN